MPVLTAFENVELPLLLTSLSRAERREHVETALALVGLADRSDALPERALRRTATARRDRARDDHRPQSSSPTNPPATSTADRGGSSTCSTRLNREIGKTIIMVTHDPKAAEKAHRMVHLEKGVLVD